MLNFLRSILTLNVALASKVRSYQAFEEAVALYDAKDYKAAFPIMQEAAELGSPDAVVRMGIIFMQGLGVPPDWKEAARYFENAISLAVPKVYVNLGLLNGIGGYGLKRDLDKAKALLEAADKEGDSKAAELLQMLAKKQGIFGMKETARPAIPWK